MHLKLRSWLVPNDRSCLPVPVRVFNGSLDEAINEALKGNSKDKLAMSPREKSEAAWRLVTGTALRTFQIVESSTRSKPTILKMRSVKANLGKQNPSLDFAGLSWENAQRLHKGQELVTKKSIMNGSIERFRNN